MHAGFADGPRGGRKSGAELELRGALGFGADEMVGYTSRPVGGVEQLAGAKRGALEAASLWFGLRPFDICALLIVTGNCDWQS